MVEGGKFEGEKRERGGKVVNGLVEIVPKSEVCDVWGEVVDRLVEAQAKFQEGERRRQIICVLIELITCIQFGEIGEAGGGKIEIAKIIGFERLE